MWLPEDTQAALEWADWDASLCSGCGFPRSESMDTGRQDEWEAHSLTCFACKARDEEDRQAGDAKSSGEYGSGAFDGLKLSIVRKDT